MNEQPLHQMSESGDESLVETLSRMADGKPSPNKTLALHAVSRV